MCRITLQRIMQHGETHCDMTERKVTHRLICTCTVGHMHPQPRTSSNHTNLYTFKCIRETHDVALTLPHTAVVDKQMCIFIVINYDFFLWVPSSRLILINLVPGSSPTLIKVLKQISCMQ